MGDLIGISLFALVVGGLGFVAGIDTGRLQILNEAYTCEKDINDKWQCRENEK